MAQLLRPIADVINSGWVRGDGAGSALYSAIDEATAADTDFVRSDQVSSPATLVERIEVGSDPGSNAGHILRYRYRKDSSAGDTTDLDVILMANDWEVHTAAHDNISQTIAAGTFTLTSDEVAEFRARGGYDNAFVKLVRRKRATITTSSNVTYTTSPSTLHCDIRRPSTGGPYPVIVTVHDSGFQTNDLSLSQPWCIRMSQEEGFATINPEVRVAPGALAPAPLDDCADLIDFIAANAGTYNLDANKIAFIGGSGGGHVAVWMSVGGSFMTSGQFARVRCTAACSPPTDFRAALGDGANSPTQSFEAYLGVTEAASPSTWDLWSPALHTTASSKPVYMANSVSDNIPLAQSQRLATALTANGVANRVILIPGSEHGTSLIDNVTQWAEMITWLHRYLG